MLVVFNSNHGPWMSGAFLAQKAEAAALFREVTGPELLMDYLDDVAEEQGLPVDGSVTFLYDSIFEMETFRAPGELAGPLARIHCFQGTPSKE